MLCGVLEDPKVLTHASVKVHLFAAKAEWPKLVGQGQQQVPNVPQLIEQDI